MSSQNPLEGHESAIKNGKRLCKELTSFEAQPPLPAELASCRYKFRSGRLSSYVENSLRPMLLTCGISISNSTYVEVSSVGAPKYYDSAYSNWFDPVHGLIVCNESYSSRDTNSGDKRVWLSEVLWQWWKSTVLGAGKLASDLVAVVRLNIINQVSQIANGKLRSIRHLQESTTITRSSTPATTMAFTPFWGLQTGRARCE